MDDTGLTQRYWGKAKPTQIIGPQWHPLVYHSLDVAACGHQLLVADTARCRRLAQLSDLADEKVLSWLSFLLGIHDIGKFSDGFQNQQPELLQALQGRSTRVSYDERHDTLGWIFAREFLPAAFAAEDAETLWDLLGPWVAAVTGHHGRPPNNLESHRVARLLTGQFPPTVRQDAQHFLRTALQVLLPDGLPFRIHDYDQIRPRFLRTSWLVAGLAVAADWLGSNQQWFPYWEGAPLPLERYWREVALPRANTALQASGLAPALAASFRGITALFEGVQVPTPLQQLAETMTLAPGPQLIVIEEVTGGGKTEAALTLAARLLAIGAADGLYLALPTMATADAMHRRVERVYQRFFAPDAQASLVLAHSAAAFTLALERANHADAGYGPQEHDSASGHCTAWLADSRKKALLAHVGVGTIDQALLGILAAKHQSLRLWGLLGLMAAALGLKRPDTGRDDTARAALEVAHRALAQGYGFAVRVDAPGLPLVDYHTAQVPSSGTGRNRRQFATRRDEVLTVLRHDLNTLPSRRDYRVDALYTVALWARATAPYALPEIAARLHEPVFALYLGRKSCPLALPLAAQVVAAETILQAMAQAALPLPEAVERSLALSRMVPALYWEEDGEAGCPVQHTFTRRDAVASRHRWQFQSRSEHHAALPAQEANDV